MELIYLYIENYKNIKNQGFNFSPRFKCSFEDGVLRIGENKNYKSIFPENVNITAIVGKNGSGKSNLSELLLFILKNREYLNNIKYILVFKQNDICYKVNDLEIKKLDNKTAFQVKKSHIRFENNLILNIEHTLIKNTKENHWYKKLIEEQKLRDYENFYTKFPYLLNQINRYIECINKIRFDIFFNIFVLNIKLFNIDRFYYKMQEDKHYASLLIKKFISDFLQLKNLNPLQKIKKQNIFEKKIISVDNILFYNAIFSFLHFIYINKDYIKKQNLKELIKKIESLIIDTNFILDSVFEITKMTVFNTSDAESDKYLESRIELFIKFFKYIKSIQPEFSIIIDNNISFQYDINENEKIIKIIQNTYYLLYFDEDFISNFFIDYISYDFWYINKNKIVLQYKDLSNGEKTILSTITDIVYYINNHKEAKIILFDEIDETLHPEWKRKLIDILLCIFKKLQRNLHIILTTHSPFILSDIPKENIIFLEDGENKSDEVEIDTFGANIHTLLSHGFFMEDGLMGEFAKEKINEVIKFLNDKESKIKNKDEAKNIINKIGEPFLKQKLVQKYEEKFLEDLIDEKIKELEKQIKELENVKNRNK